MAESAHTYLANLGSKWTPSLTYFQSATRHRHGIETRLDNWFGVREMFETGSLRHGTGVGAYSDADYIVSLKGDRPTPDTALDRVRRALLDKYPNTTIEVSRPAVVCEFAGGVESVEVVPAYAADYGYWIPDPTGAWMRAYPKAHNRYVNEANQLHSGGAKKLARLAKVWKYLRGVPVSSCYLEMRAAKYASEESSWSMPMELPRYFAWLSDLGFGAMNDPTYSGVRFTACSTEAKREIALLRLNTALSRARRARDSYLAGNNSQAVAEYRLLFNQ